MSDTVPFSRITVVGTGLIGGSWGLALKRRSLAEQVVGCDQSPVLDHALRLGAIDRCETRLAEAVRHADLVILAAPVGVITEQLDGVRGRVPPHALITDTGSTKRAILERAGRIFNGGPLFVSGHPLAGKEHSGIGNASAGLFEDTGYILTSLSAKDREDPRVRAFVGLIEAVGARPFWCDAETHDRALAFLSHLPQIVSTALAATIAAEDGRDRLPLELAGGGFRDMTRLGESPYAIWRDVCLTNRDQIDQALSALIHKLEIMRTQLAAPELEREFQRAFELRERWRNLRTRD